MPSSSQMSSSLRSFAEDPAAFGELDPATGFERVLTDRYCLLLGPVPSFTQVSRLRLDPDAVPETIAEVRSETQARGHRAAVWHVSTSSTPGDLTDRLLTHGFKHEDHHAVMMLDREPPPGPPDVVARRVRDVEEFRVAARLGHEIFETEEERRREWESLGDERFAAERDDLAPRTYLAFVGDRPVGAATAWVEDSLPAVLLVGGAVLPDARGRGAYRALVRARWDDAVAAGKPALTVSAGAMSRPILERLGFETVGEQDVLLDPSTC